MTNILAKYQRFSIQGIPSLGTPPYKRTDQQSCAQPRNPLNLEMECLQANEVPSQGLIRRKLVISDVPMCFRIGTPSKFIHLQPVVELPQYKNEGEGLKPHRRGLRWARVSSAKAKAHTYSLQSSGLTCVITAPSPPGVVGVPKLASL